MNKFPSFLILGLIICLICLCLFEFLDFKAHKAIIESCVKHHCTLVCETKIFGKSINAYILQRYAIDLKRNTVIDLQSYRVFDLSDCMPLKYYTTVK